MRRRFCTFQKALTYYGLERTICRISVSEYETFVSGSQITPDSFSGSLASIQKIMKELPNTFGDTLVAHMKRKSVTNEQLSEASLLSDRQISRYRSSPDISITLGSVAALCIGLHLHSLLCFDMSDMLPPPIQRIEAGASRSSALSSTGSTGYPRVSHGSVSQGYCSIAMPLFLMLIAAL